MPELMTAPLLTVYRYRIAVPLSFPKEPDGLLDYLSAEPLNTGTPVSVSVRQHATLGIVWSEVSQQNWVSSPLKTIEKAWITNLVSPEHCRFIGQVARYYHQPLGRMLNLSFPPDAKRYFEKPPRASRPPSKSTSLTRKPLASHTLTVAQQAIVEAITTEPCQFSAHLIHGITGSGKTEIYRRLAKQVIEQGKQVLWLVPEIKLTPQLLQQLAPEWADQMVALHSHLAGGQRFKAWQRAQQGDAELIIGTRLAIFTPLPRLGLIIIDEEHDASFCQTDNIRYHARDVAVWRAKHFNCPIILGSATPSLESYVNATQRHIYHYHALLQRAVTGATLPAIYLTTPDKKASFPWSNSLDQALEQRLHRKEQSLVFLNRRGYAPMLHCATCSWTADCKHCSAKMVWHKDQHKLRCHHCGTQYQVPRQCPTCGHPDIFPMGLGTQKLEEALQTRFPDATILRVDQDSMSKKKAWEEALANIASGHVNRIVGTQMLAKGHHFPLLTLVGILGIDDALFSADFRAAEHAFAQLTQVAGRAGREKNPGDVFIETGHPDHPLFQSILKNNYNEAAQSWIQERQNHQLPPFSYYALLWAESRQADLVQSWIQHTYQFVLNTRAQQASAIDITPPMPALMEKKKGWHRYYFALSAVQRPYLHAMLNKVEQNIYQKGPNHKIRWRIDVDPPSL